MSRHLSVRIGDEVFAQLEAQSRRSGQSRFGGRQAAAQGGAVHGAASGIVFRLGPGGRRAG